MYLIALLDLILNSCYHRNLSILDVEVIGIMKILLITMLLFFSAWVNAGIYKWTDEKWPTDSGTKNMTFTQLLALVGSTKNKPRVLTDSRKVQPGDCFVPGLVLAFGAVHHAKLGDLEVGGVLALFFERLDVERRGIRSECGRQVITQLRGFLDRLGSARADPDRRVGLLQRFR